LPELYPPQSGTKAINAKESSDIEDEDYRDIEVLKGIAKKEETRITRITRIEILFGRNADFIHGDKNIRGRGLENCINLSTHCLGS